MDDETTVCAGDIILLKVRKDNPADIPYLCSDGIVFDDLSIISVTDVNDIQDIRDCLFKVVYKLNYSAYKDYKRLKRAKADKGDLEPAREKYELENEQNLEKALRTGPITYGECIQLLHVKSNKYVTIIPRQGAPFLKQARHVEVRDTGDAHSAFRVTPFYRHKLQGEQVKYKEQVIFQALKLGPKWFLHWTKNEVPMPQTDELRKFHEVDCSTIKDQGFFPMLYIRDPSKLNISYSIMLFHSQSEGHVGASCATEDPTVKRTEPKRPYLRMLDVSNYDDPSNLWSKGVWVLQGEEAAEGGSVKWGGSVCFKHSGTGKFLAVDRNCKTGDSYMTTMKSTPDDDCKFVLEKIDTDPVKEIGNYRPKCLINFQGWKNPAKLWLTAGGRKTKDPNLDEFLVKTRPSLVLLFSPQRKIRDAVQIEVLSGNTKPSDRTPYVTDINTVMGRKRFMYHTMKRIEKVPRPNPLPSNPTPEQAALEEERMQFVKDLAKCLEESIFFLAPTDIEDLDALKAPKACNAQRQKIVRELKYVDSSVQLQVAMWSAGYKVTEKSSRAEVDLGLAKGQPKPAGLLGYETRTLKLFLQFWQRVFQDNRAAENYFDRMQWLALVNNLNGLGLGAAAVLMAMVCDNPRLVQKVDLSVIETFISFIKDLGPDDTWPNFLKAVCSCDGMAISSKQQAVLRMVYDQGINASTQEKKKYGQNREQILLACRKGEVIEPFPDMAPRGVEMLGQKLVSQGIYDILVTWHSEEEPWAMGKDWFYFSPKLLQLLVTTVKGKHWVSLQSVCWVLNADRCYHVVHKCNPEDWPIAEAAIKKDKFKSGRFKALTVLANYFTAQLEMLSEMCYKRQVNAILSLEQEYQIDIILCGIWCNGLPPAVRCAFAGLLDNLWLDRHPHRESSMPDLIRKWTDVQVSKDPALPRFELLDDTPDGGDRSEFYTMSEPSKFKLVLAYIQHHMEQMNGKMVHSHQGHVKYTSQLMEIMLHLFKFGFIYEWKQLAEMAKPMVLCLDGRTDWLDAPKGAPAKTEQQGDGADESSSRIPLLAALKPKAAPPVPRQELPPAGTDGPMRYKCNEMNMNMMQCKRYMCKVCSEISELAADYGVSRILQMFKREITKNARGVPVTEKLVDEMLEISKDKVSDFDSFARANFNTLLIDLCMYDHGSEASADCFSAAIDVMHGWNQRLSLIVRSLNQVKILLEEKDVIAYELVRVDVVRLANLCATHESWGCEDSFGPIDMHRVEEFKLLAIRLRQLSSDGGEVTGDNDTPDTDMQDILQNLRLGDAVLDAFRIPIQSLSPQAKHVCQEMMSLVCSMVTQFIKGHSRNQQFMFEALDLLRKWFNFGVGVANCIAMVFQGNRQLCENVPDSLVRDFCTTLAKRSRGFLPHQVTFLQSIVAVGERPILRNKQIVVELLKEGGGVHFGEGKVLHLLNTREGRQRREQLLNNFASWSELDKPEMFRKWKGDDAEIMYHNKVIELLALLCLGRDRIGGVAFVQSLVGARDVGGSFCDADKVQQAASGAKNYTDVLRICRLLKASFAKLLRYCYYDTEMKDVLFLESKFHVSLLETIHAEFGQLFQSSAGPHVKSSLDETYIHDILGALNAYFEHGYKAADAPAHVKECVEGKFVPLCKELLLDKYKVPECNDLFKKGLQRAIGWLTGDADAKCLRLLPPTKEANKGNQSDSASTLVHFQSFVGELVEHPKVLKQLEEDRQHMIQQFLEIPDTTDPTNQAYQKEKKEAESANRNLKMDFRRNKIRLEEILQRMITYCLDNLTVWHTTSQILHILVEMLGMVGREQGPAAAIKKKVKHLQDSFAKSGVVDLVVYTLMEKPESTISIVALRVGVAMLEPVNEVVQQKFTDIFLSIDDSGLWEAMSFLYDTCLGNMKHARHLKAIQRTAKPGEMVVTPNEEMLLKMFENDCNAVITAMRLQQTLCEGHLAAVQQYIFQQTDNSVSFNFSEKNVDICIKLSKNEAACDLMDEKEKELLVQGIELLIEMNQGPEERNQLFSSVSGIVEVVQKILRAQFLWLIHLADDDPYPEHVREIKEKMMLLLLSMIETRRDYEAHKNLLFRLDVFALKNRIVYIHRYLLSYVLKLGECDVNNLVLFPLPKDFVDEVQVPTTSPAVLLEEFVDDDLQSYFGEAFNIMMLLYQIWPVDGAEEFRLATKPKIPEFVDDKTTYIDEDSYKKAKGRFEAGQKYSQAFTFFNYWIKSIEALIADSQGKARLYDYFFRMPVLCDFVLGATKRMIYQTINIDSPDDKAKDFLKKCISAYEQTVHTRGLSKYSIPMASLFPKVARRPFHFFLKNDSKNLLDMEKYTLGIATLTNCILFNNLILPEGGGDPVWASVTVGFVVFLTGLLQYVLQVIALLVTLILYSPLDYKDFAKSCNPNMKLPETIIFCVAAGVGSMGVIQMSKSVPLGVVVFLVACNIADGRWTCTLASKECPNNQIALSVKTMCKGLRQKPIVRRVVFCLFSGMALTGRYYFYPFGMLDLIFQKPMLENVMKAVTLPFEGLCWTSAVGVIIMYSYAVLGFYLFRHDFDGACQNVPDCTFVTIYQGFRDQVAAAMSGADPSSDNWYARMTYDLSYFVVMTVIFMNVIAGMVIDTFGSLRDETQSREEYQKTYCFISSLDRGEVDKVANALNYDLDGCLTGYDHLETKKQDKWNYLNFIFYLKRRSPTDFTGPDSKIFALLADEDTTWFPIERCIMMEGDTADADDPVTLGAIQELFDGVNGTLGDMQEKFDKLNESLETVMGQVGEMFEDFSEKKGK